ncbi:beta-lactam-binding protein with PASTA domain [Kutzneria viridogrisea]|uniref:Beta-lactam-binding protein with PASTA domain n=1 Tax=Kutzneria viridogrisea TaxID=47990 RepID=A0ABR6BE09_9PSEU|nr:PASTA domain-containing protein [Kutzneria albida]MBA8925096.1 beta-lactam-binding protein with PASTA domain [Kutzneria viridogrisea]
MLAAVLLVGATTVPASAAPVGPLAVASWVAPQPSAMPDVVGKGLYDAESAVPLGTKIDLVDGLGLGRRVLWPFNWKVCKQDPAPGAALNSGVTVTLTVVKRAETCK